MIDHSKIITKEMAEARKLEELAEQIRSIRNDKLRSDYESSVQQLIRWIDEAEDNPAALAEYKTQRSAWHTWADALCDLPDQPGFPWPESEVLWPKQPPKPTRYTAP
ncbi:tail fiber assembly protein [Desulfoluna spongiiphila]|uniref:hypothetical protein n=1 Tax=Desulfoluna spongiiphila TaxID=419481 RepID=UPI001256F7DA|nr:hypothetical protein [Desulfoluna spongiiphila]VVS92175.1 consensus disorder prediction [Desulfoluna spongiiphila]